MVLTEARVIDSTHLELASPIDRPLGSRVVVSVSDEQEERELWMRASADGLRGAYGDSEPEYTLEMVKERNPEFSA